MALQAILVLTLAAGIHSTWNLLAKRSRDKQAFLWLAVMTAAVLFAPVAALVALQAPPAAAGWPFLAASAALEAGYYLLLGGAYQRGDLSLVYPLARGSAPLFVTLGAAALLGERVSGPGVAGIALIVAGIYVLHLRAVRGRALLAPLLALRDASSRMALLAGLFIACYSLVDKVGVRYFPPLLYIELIFVGAGLLVAPYLLGARRAVVAQEWRLNARTIVVVAVLNLAAYLLVLITLQSSQVSYVSSVREMSVVFAAVLGLLVLREPFGPTKLLGAALIFAGIICIGLGR